MSEDWRLKHIDRAMTILEKCVRESEDIEICEPTSDRWMLDYYRRKCVLLTAAADLAITNVRDLLKMEP